MGAIAFTLVGFIIAVLSLTAPIIFCIAKRRLAGGPMKNTPCVRSRS